MRISDWSSDVCSSDLPLRRNDLTIVVALLRAGGTRPIEVRHLLQGAVGRRRVDDVQRHDVVDGVPEGGMQFLLGRAGCQQAARSDESRVGKECVNTCRSRWLHDNEKTKIHYI